MTKVQKEDVFCPECGRRMKKGLRHLGYREKKYLGEAKKEFFNLLRYTNLPKKKLLKKKRNIRVIIYD